MKNQKNKTISFKKFVIAKINRNELLLIKGGDCVPTDPTWRQHGQTGMNCDGKPMA